MWDPYLSCVPFSPTLRPSPDRSRARHPRVGLAPHENCTPGVGRGCSDEGGGSQAKSKTPLGGFQVVGRSKGASDPTELDIRDSSPNKRRPQ